MNLIYTILIIAVLSFGAWLIILYNTKGKKHEEIPRSYDERLFAINHRNRREKIQKEVIRQLQADDFVEKYFDLENLTDIYKNFQITRIVDFYFEFSFYFDLNVIKDEEYNMIMAKELNRETAYKRILNNISRKNDMNSFEEHRLKESGTIEEIIDGAKAEYAKWKIVAYKKLRFMYDIDRERLFLFLDYENNFPQLGLYIDRGEAEYKLTKEAEERKKYSHDYIYYKSKGEEYVFNCSLKGVVHKAELGQDTYKISILLDKVTILTKEGNDLYIIDVMEQFNEYIKQCVKKGNCPLCGISYGSSYAYSDIPCEDCFYSHRDQLEQFKDYN